jgi:hypothetical protein
LKGCLAGTKKLLTLREASPVCLPKLSEFNAEKLFKEAIADPTAAQYLPDALPGAKQRSCGRKFLFTVSTLFQLTSTFSCSQVINTLSPDWFKAQLTQALRNRKESQALSQNKYIEVSSQFLHLITNSQHISKCK